MTRARGFTLLKVMLLTMMASIIVFATLKDTIIQERLTGNFQKDINSRLLAENGIFKSAENLLAEASKKVNKGLSLDALLAIEGVGNMHGGKKDDLAFATYLTKNAAGLLEIASIGARYNGDAQSRLVALFEYKQGNEPVFNSAVTGCRGVNLSGSGLVDSYDSSKGSYDDTKTDKGDVNTLIEDADITINGHSPINGDIKASGILYLKGSSPVLGDIQAVKGVDISWGDGVRVEGNVLTQGFYIQRGGEIKGYVRANGDVDMKWGSRINNFKQADFDIQYGGKGLFSDQMQSLVPDGRMNVSYKDAVFNVNPHAKSVDSSHSGEPEKGCDPLTLGLKMASIIDSTNTYQDFSVGSVESYVFTPNKGEFTKSQTIKSVQIAQQKAIYLFDKLPQNHGNTDKENEYVFTMKNALLSHDAQVTISGGDVIWLIDGDLTLSGHSQLTIEKNSSLTIFVTGKVNFGASAQINTEQQGITKSGHAVMSVYSSYKHSDGIIIAGASDLYASVYAPFTSVNLTGSGQLFGSIRGALINASGSSSIHYDGALKTLDIGSDTGKSKPSLIFKGWYFKPIENKADESGKV